MNEANSASEGLPKHARLLKTPDFRRVFDAKQSAADKVLIVYGTENGMSQTRLGLAVSRKVGNAVVRNQWKRQIREAFRLRLNRLPTGIDIVVLPRGDANPNSMNVQASLVSLTHQLARKLFRRKP